MGSDQVSETLTSEWRAGRLTTVDLFAAVRDPMRQSARRGIRRVLNERPDVEDVDDVLFVAFRELLGKDPDDVTSVVGMAKTIAHRRGIDRGRKVRRQREKIAEIGWQLGPQDVSLDDELAEADTNALLRRQQECMESLTPEQRDVIEETIMKLRTLSEWSAERGTSHQAASAMRSRALQALRRCVEAKRAIGMEGGES